MLVIRVEVWPGGDSDGALEISRIGVANVSQMASRSDYEVTALLARDDTEEVVRTEVRDHERSAGWIPLVRRTLTNLMLRNELAQDASYDDPVAELLRRGKRV